MNFFETENADCILCGEIEDDDHFFKCNDPIMQDAQEEIIMDLCKSLKKINTSPSIIRTMKLYIQKWMSNKNHTQITTLHPNIQHHQEITLAIKQQEHIGWDHFVRGRLSKLWKVAQKTYQGQKYTSKWPLLCIKAIATSTQKIWEIRNIMKFGTDSQVMTNHQNRLKPKIMAYYNTYRQTIPRTQHKLFQVPLQIRLTFSPKENTQWIETKFLSNYLLFFSHPTQT